MIFICEVCTIEFERPPSDNPRHCSRKCYDKSRECIKRCKQCNKRFKSYRVRNRKFCSDKCARLFNKAENHYHWKGGKTNKGEYVYIYAPYHPAVSSNKHIAEHRLVVEKYLGRFLHSNEIVHHINHNKKDNRIENLMVVTRSEHRKIHPPR